MMQRHPKSAAPALTRRFAVTLEYDGAAFAGFQLQPNAETVQAVLERALKRLFKEERRVAGASRTDSGVHARGQVAVFELAHALPPARLTAALNSALPPAARVVACRRVPAGWDPRQRARRKTYRYLVFNRPVFSPLWIGRAWQVAQPLDLDAMRRAARHLLGRRDFSAFRAAGCEARHPVRTLLQAGVQRRGPLLTFTFTADAFLYKMVRALAGTLVWVGQGRFKPADIPRILRGRDRAQAGPTAPACGLYLEKIVFGRKSGD
ncbi:MAG: tRNA pseudouridine(38-40) synthase TruA [candidate division FCPU426 bacterium]